MYNVCIPLIGREYVTRSVLIRGRFSPDDPGPSNSCNPGLVNRLSRHPKSLHNPVYDAQLTESGERRWYMRQAVVGRASRISALEDYRGDHKNLSTISANVLYGLRTGAEIGTHSNGCCICRRLCYF